jgi:hypothetical protein
MYPIRVDVNEWSKHESSLMTPRVWQCKRGGVELNALHRYQIKVERSRTEAGIGVSDSPEGGLHIEQAGESLKRSSMHFKRYHPVDEGGLIFLVHRGRLIERRTSGRRMKLPFQ